MRSKTLVPVLLVLAVRPARGPRATRPASSGARSPIPTAWPMPGVTVTVASPALQGARTVVTSEQRRLHHPVPAAGRVHGHLRTAGLRAAEARRSASPWRKRGRCRSSSRARVGDRDRHRDRRRRRPEILTTGTHRADLHGGEDRVAAGGPDAGIAAVLLAPGVSGNGPSGNIVIAGALSYEGLYLINGVNVNENLRGQPRTLYVEDAIQETKVSSGNISAEYGRFNGGVVNMITKSGGNSFSGSFRDSLQQRLLAVAAAAGRPEDRPARPDLRGHVRRPDHEGQDLVLHRRALPNNKQQRVLDYTLLSYPYAQSDKRYEGKGTYAINSAEHAEGVVHEEVDLDDEQHLQQPDRPRQPVQQRHDRHADGRQLHQRALLEAVRSRRSSRERP